MIFSGASTSSVGFFSLTLLLANFIHKDLPTSYLHIGLERYFKDVIHGTQLGDAILRQPPTQR